MTEIVDREPQSASYSDIAREAAVRLVYGGEYQPLFEGPNSEINRKTVGVVIDQLWRLGTALQDRSGASLDTWAYSFDTSGKLGPASIEPDRQLLLDLAYKCMSSGDRQGAILPPGERDSFEPRPLQPDLVLEPSVFPNLNLLVVRNEGRVSEIVVGGNTALQEFMQKQTGGDNLDYVEEQIGQFGK